MKKRFLALALSLALCLSLTILPASAADNTVKQIEAGHKYTLVVTNDGTLYGCGYNRHNVLGPDVETINDGSVSNVVPRPQKIAEGVKEAASNVFLKTHRKMVSFGASTGYVEMGDHCLILMENGDLYAQGDNYYGQLGQGTLGPDADYTGMQFVMGNVAHVAAGDTFSACITEDGELYWWGQICQTMGGRVEYYMNGHPQNVGGDYVALDAGSGHIVALKADGTVWTLGSKDYGACGDGQSSGISLEPTQVFSGAVAVTAGSNHTLVLTANGDVYGWGDNSSKQLSLERTFALEPYTTPQYIMGGAKAIEAGYDNSCVIKNNGDLWIFGTSYDGQFGMGYTDHDGSPVKTASNVKAVSIGFRSTFILKEDGTTYAAGNNYDYNFGNGSRYYNVLSWTPALLTASPILEEGEVPFTDVKAGDYFYQAVQWAVAQRVTTGTSVTTFSPDTICDRAQIITFLWRGAGSVAPSAGQNHFKDVKADAYYSTALCWAQQYSITSSVSGSLFYPHDPCTRAMAVEFMWRAAGSPAYDPSLLPFTDVKAGDSYAQAVAWALDTGVTTGTSATTFSPNAPCTRAQIATLLYRAFG